MHRPAAEGDSRPRRASSAATEVPSRLVRNSFLTRLEDSLSASRRWPHEECTYFVFLSSRTDRDHDVVGVTSFLALDVVELKKKMFSYTLPSHQENVVVRELLGTAFC